jgi:hypothetical protein
MHTPSDLPTKYYVYLTIQLPILASPTDSHSCIRLSNKEYERVRQLMEMKKEDYSGTVALKYHGSSEQNCTEPQGLRSWQYVRNIVSYGTPTSSAQVHLPCSTTKSERATSALKARRYTSPNRAWPDLYMGQP